MIKLPLLMLSIDFEGYEQIKAKERYQLRQISNISSTKSVKDPNEQMGQNQIDSMKDVLKEDGEKITAMVKTINAMKKDLAV